MYGLVLAGGGGKGSYHIGVWKALKEMNIKIKAVTGTSVGSLNGAFVAQDAYEDALNIWSNITVDQVLAVDRDYFSKLISMNISINKETIASSLKHLEDFYKKKGFDITPLKRLIETYVDEDLIRKSPISYGLVTVSLTDWKPLEIFIEDIPKGKLIDYMLASSFLPGFMPMELDGKRFLDGGFHDNLPINLIATKGINKIIAVDLKGFGRKQAVKKKGLEITHISPSSDLGMTLEFDSSRARKNIQMGYLDTLKAFNYYGGNHYYITDIPSSDDIFTYISLINEREMAIVFKILKVKGPRSKRMFCERVIPAIAYLFNCSDKDDYNMILIKIIEYLAKYYHLERLKPYSFHKLIELILTADEPEETNPRNLGNMLETMKNRFVTSIPKVDFAKIVLTSYKEFIKKH